MLADLASDGIMRGRKVTPKREGRRDVPLSRSPRGVPFGATIIACFGGYIAQTGYATLIGASVAIWNYPMQSEMITPFVFRGDVATTSGTVLETESFQRRRRLFTRVPNMLEVPVLRVRFQYVVDGMAYEQFSFTPMGAEISPMHEVEYLVANPQIARLRGMRYYYFSAWSTLWVFIFALIGLLMVLPRLCAAADQVELLRHGAITHGTLVEKRGGGEDGMCACVFEFQVPVRAGAGGDGQGDASIGGGGGGSIRGASPKAATAKQPPRSSKQPTAAMQPTGYQPLTYRVEHIDMSTASVEDELFEPILYLPTDPNIATLVDGLTVQPTAEGHWAAPSGWWQYLLGPLTLLVTNVLFARNYRS